MINLSCQFIPQANSADPKDGPLWAGGPRVGTMTDFNRNEYFQILTEIIRENLVVPFSCYILLRANNRAICLVESNHPFDKLILDKLKSFQFNELYIKNEERPLYEAYLRQFFQTTEGKALAQTLREKNPVGPIPGVPDALTEEVRNASAQAPVAEPPVPAASPAPISPDPLPPTEPSPTAALEPSSEPAAQEPDKGEGFGKKTEARKEQVQRIQGSAQDEQNNERIAVAGGNTNDASEAISSEEAPPVAENPMVELLQKQTQALEESLKIKGSLTREEKQIIQDATEKIELEIERVRGIKEPESDGSKEVIKDATDRINEAFERVAGVADKPGRELGGLKRKANAMKKRVADILRISGSGMPDNEEVEDPVTKSKIPLKKSRKNLAEEIQQIKRLVTSEPQEIVAESVKDIIQGLETIMGVKLEIQAAKPKDGTDATNEADPEAGSHAMEADEAAESDDAENTSESESPAKKGKKKKKPGETIEALKEKLEIQRRTIGLLNDRLKESKTQLNAVKSRWDEFQARAIPKLDDQEKMAAKSFELNLRDLDTAYTGIKKPIESLRENAQVLSDLAGMDSESGKPVDDAPAQAAEQSPVNTAESLTLPPESDANASIENVRSENALLRSQLENAKALLDKSQQRIDNLQSYVDTNTPYLETLEKEVSEFKKLQEHQMERIMQLEKSNNELTEATTSAHRIATRGKQEIVARDQMINQLREQLQYYETELNTFKEKFKSADLSKVSAEQAAENEAISTEAMGLLKAKDAVITQMNRKLEMKLQEVRELEKENAKLKNASEENNNLKRRVAQKAERLEAEKVSMRQEYEALNRRLMAATNVLDTERKSVAKLTSITEELKKERMDFMNKTNAAMKEYRSALSKANSLTNNVQNEIERNKKIQDEADKYKAKSRELVTQVSALEKDKKALEIEIKKLKIQLERSGRKAA